MKRADYDKQFPDQGRLKKALAALNRTDPEAAYVCERHSLWGWSLRDIADTLGHAGIGGARNIEKRGWKQLCDLYRQATFEDVGWTT